ncbi:MAG: radical SAM domain protein [Euryarchaeota archaeon]|nr:radical SAM domain protein [Euryarchaeota archaeon]
MWTRNTNNSKQQGSGDSTQQKTTNSLSVPTALNWHCEAVCNYDCTFCYAPFEDQRKRSRLTSEEGCNVIENLGRAGIEKINFVGGEPMLHPHIQDWIRHSKKVGMTTSIVSNGTRMNGQFLSDMVGHLDWLGLSIDASSDELHAMMGRGLKGEIRQGYSDHLNRTKSIVQKARQLGFGIKLNTVVTSVNVDDDMSDLVRWINPNRWKIFQVLPIEGENDHMPREFLIDSSQFSEYVERHKMALSDVPEVEVVGENNDQMLGTYAMMDAQTLVYTNMNGHYEYSTQPVLDIGFSKAWEQVNHGFSNSQFQQRGGQWDWNRKTPISLPMVQGGDE